MKSVPFNFKEVNEYLPIILIIGIALGIGGYAIGFNINLGQSIIQHVLVSLLIGYSILWIAFNSSVFLPATFTSFQNKAILIILFGGIGVIASEIEILVNTTVFQQTPYHFFSGGGIYLFNAILSIILGFANQTWVNLKAVSKQSVVQKATLNEKKEEKEILTTVPIQQGDAIVLYAIQDIIFFEAYDNYSFLYDLNGNRYLCNYSLLFLEKKLPKHFLRVHRKYLINREQILQIKPHLKGRYVIEFKDKKHSTITSSNSYSELIKAIIKL